MERSLAIGVIPKPRTTRAWIQNGQDLVFGGTDGKRAKPTSSPHQRSLESALPETAE